MPHILNELRLDRTRIKPEGAYAALRYGVLGPVSVAAGAALYLQQ